MNFTHIIMVSMAFVPLSARPKLPALIFGNTLGEPIPVYGLIRTQTVASERQGSVSGSGSLYPRPSGVYPWV